MIILYRHAVSFMLLHVVYKIIKITHRKIVVMNDPSLAKDKEMVYSPPIPRR